MQIFSKLVPLFIIIPLAELYILIQVGKIIGTWETIALVIITGIIGAWLMQIEGLRIWAKLQQELMMAKMPADQIIDGVLVLIGGILLLTPGVVTDFFGLTLIFPLTRSLYRNWLRKKFAGRFKTNRQQAEVEVIEILEDKNN